MDLVLGFMSDLGLFAFGLIVFIIVCICLVAIVIEIYDLVKDWLDRADKKEKEKH